MSPLLLLALLSGCEHGFVDPSRELGEAVATAPAHPVEIHRPASLGVVDTPLRTAAGEVVGVACATCHGPDATSSWASRDGEVFHQALEHRHGGLSCDSCHSDDRLGLHLADGAPVELGDAMTLCAQCHGVQLRDYNHAAHGGMTGYWDLRRGPRDRNHCLDCHDAHAPAWSPLLPVAGPVDRGGEAL